MNAARIAVHAPRETEHDFFLMSNLSPKSTRLPFVVWISPKGGARHDIRVKVSRSYKTKPGELIVVSVRPKVEVLRGELRPSELRLLKKWIDLNRETLVKFWDGEIEYTEDALALLRPLASPRRS
jgi:hypothetical protein